MTGRPVRHVAHRIEPHRVGVSGVAVLAESHISIHTWPEHRYAAVDVFMCGKARPQVCIDVMREAFEPERCVVQEFARGSVQ